MSRTGEIHLSAITALELAVNLAAREGRARRLAHVTPTPRGTAAQEWPLLDFKAIESLSAQMIGAAAERVRFMTEARSQARAQVHVVRARAVDALVDATRNADLILLGRFGHRGHLPTQMRAILREAHCPVEVVPVNVSAIVPALAGRQRHIGLSDRGTIDSLGHDGQPYAREPHHAMVEGK